ncbi:MAG: hypothetical protein ACKO0W_10420 [Planctomycetota bacterium]
MTAPHPDRGYPTGRLLAAIALTAAGLAVLWTVIRSGWGFPDEVYRGGLLGLAVATAAHIGGTFVGAFLAPGKGVSTAYLASTVVRFLATPVLAVSLYFVLPVEPQPVLIGSAAGYLLILVADVGAMLRSTRGTAGSASL